nr:D-glycerate dehydrogenase [Croceicoccus bisphenolivorans]
MTPSSTETRRVTGTVRVGVTRHLLPSVENRMGELFDVRLNREDRTLSREELVALTQDIDVLVPTVTDHIDADLIAKAGPSMKLIANFGAGTDHIDLKAARARGIMVTNTPSAFTEDTADMTLALIIGVMRRMREGTRIIHHGQWTGWAPSAMLGRKMGGKVLGIVGMGRIGQAVAHRARAFGMRIVYHNRHRLPEAVERMLGAEYEETLAGLLANADVVTLHCPATESTHNMIDAAGLATMKQGSVLVNTARGELVDYEAMIAALESGHLWGAGLDVYPEEPKVDPRLIAHRNVITQPHLCSATEEGREASGGRVIASIRSWADGHRPLDQVLEGWV